MSLEGNLDINTTDLVDGIVNWIKKDGIRLRLYKWRRKRGENGWERVPNYDLTIHPDLVEEE